MLTKMLDVIISFENKIFLNTFWFEEKDKKININLYWVSVK